MKQIIIIKKITTDFAVSKTLYAMYEKDKILNSFPPDLAKDVRRVLDMLVMKNDDISSRYYICLLYTSKKDIGRPSETLR